MISVVVPTYNEEKNIARCLTALTNQTIPREQVEIIVVDGGSSDKTCEIASQYADVVMQQTSVGVGGARNDGFKVAKYNIVATTDADCEPYDDWLESIIYKFNHDPVVAVTGMLEPFDWQNMRRLEVLVYKSLFEISNVALYMGAMLDQYHLCGANSAFRKDVFLEIGGYLPLAYADDVEIIKRIKKKGEIELSDDMKINYSIRRIKKLGLRNYIYNIFKMDAEILVLGRKPMKGNYAKMDYD